MSQLFFWDTERIRLLYFPQQAGRRPPLLPRRIKRKRIESPTASTVPHNEVNKFSFLSAFLKRLLSNSAINPFPFLKFENASLWFSAVRPEPFSCPSTGMPLHVL
jgi:hypothetical protein